MKVGQGFDAHRFTEGDHIMLGGVKVPHTHGIEAHSDGDVLLHALCDAILGAAGMGDIGRHFPDHDNANKNRNSREFITEIIGKITKQKLTVLNVDATVILQAPKISAYIEDMQKLIAQYLSISVNNVNVKATTTERMGFVGREEGIAAMVVVLLQ